MKVNYYIAPPLKITMNQDTLMTATCCIIHCISFSLFPAENQVGGQTFASKFAFLLAAGVGMEFLCEDRCLYQVKFPIASCLWLPVNLNLCVPLHGVCRAKTLGEKPWQLPSPFCACSFGSTLFQAVHLPHVHIASVCGVCCMHV